MLAIIVAIVGIAADIATVVTIFWAVHTYHKDNERKAKQDTIEAYNAIYRSAISEICDMDAKLFNKDGDALKVKTSAHNEVTDDLVEVESFCIGVNSGIYDFDTFYQLAHGTFDSKNKGFRDRASKVINVKKSIYGRGYHDNIEKTWALMDERTLQMSVPI